MIESSLFGARALPGLLAPLLVLLALAPGCALAPPAEADDVFRSGLERAEAGDVEAAMTVLQDGVGRYPSHVRMRFELARLQYESGEVHHQQERKAMLAAAAATEAGRRDQAQSHQQQAGKHRARALPFYQAARDNLHEVIDSEDDEVRVGWAYYLLMRVAVFFEDWAIAHEAMGKAIEHGKPTGSLLAQWREYQAGLREKVDLSGER